MIRKITAATRGARSTILTLDCGHERAIGAHTMPDGEVITHVSRMLGREYDCREAMCLARSA